MRFLDLFAGIGGFRLGMEQASHHCIGFCEIDKFARRSYKAIHDTSKEVEMHDITSVSDEFIQSSDQWTSLRRISVPSFFNCGKAAKIFRYSRYFIL